MILDETQRNRSDRFHKFLKQQPINYFKKNHIILCEKCNGTGLDHTKIYDEENDNVICSWDTHSFCDNCNGIGYKGFKDDIQIDLLNFICRNCDGIGCESCNNTGIVDWVTNMMGG